MSAPIPAVEREVLVHLLSGLTVKEIAQVRGRSPHTIVNQVASVHRRFKVKSLVELMAVFCSLNVDKLSQLSAVEQEVARCLVAGMSANATAVAVDRPRSTVARLIARICDQLGARRHHPAEAVRVLSTVPPAEVAAERFPE